MVKDDADCDRITINSKTTIHCVYLEEEEEESTVKCSSAKA